MKNNQKVFTSIVIIIVVSIAGYFALTKKSNNVNTAEPLPFVSAQTDTSNWKTYTNTQYRFEFKYPETWMLGESSFGEENLHVAVDPKVDPQEVMFKADLYKIDVPAGLISIYVEQCTTQACYHVSGYDSFEKVNIGGNSIEARKYESSNEKNSPNPAYLGTHSITYYVDYGKNNEYRATITYVSDMSDKYLNEFNQILSTFKFTK